MHASTAAHLKKWCSVIIWSVISAKSSALSRGAFPIDGDQQRALFLKRAVKQRALLAKRAVKTEGASRAFSDEGGQNI